MERLPSQDLIGERAFSARCWALDKIIQTEKLCAGGHPATLFPRVISK